MKNIIFFVTFFIVACSAKPIASSSIPAIETVSVPGSKIKVLNVGSFHFGKTSDATKVDFDENDLSNQEEIKTISKLIARFKPTIICLEFLPENKSSLLILFRTSQPVGLYLWRIKHDRV